MKRCIILPHNKYSINSYLLVFVNNANFCNIIVSVVNVDHVVVFYIDLSLISSLHIISIESSSISESTSDQIKTEHVQVTTSETESKLLNNLEMFVLYKFLISYLQYNIINQIYYLLIITIKLTIDLLIY